ncbi:MAG: hypothetical protein EXR73_01725 [Myxococcales bacterium]|nr:hypothetical protein [Myxococcales bacterium]
MPRLTRLYIGLCLILVVVFAGLTFTWWEPAPSPETFIPASVRTSPGGYRSHHYWYTGYHGGK